MKNWNESKKELKAAIQEEFPGIKFSMRKRNYDTLDIDFTDTDTTQSAVQSFVRKYNGKSFDGMTDSESYNNTGLAFGYIFVNREITDKKREDVFNSKISGKTLDGIEMNMSFEKFMNLDFYSSEYKPLVNWGLDPSNMIYRFLTQGN